MEFYSKEHWISKQRTITIIKKLMEEEKRVYKSTEEASFRISEFLDREGTIEPYTQGNQRERIECLNLNSVLSI